MFKIFRFISKRFNFSYKIDFTQKKSKSLHMENKTFASWAPPSKKSDTFLTGLHVNNSLYPLKPVHIDNSLKKSN